MSTASAEGAAQPLPVSGRDDDELLALAGQFTGRTWVLERLAQWLAGSEPVFLLTGGPGTGKSALAAHLVRLARDDATADGALGLDCGSIALAHFCRARDPRLLDPVRFVELLGARIAASLPSYADALTQLGDQQITINATQSVGVAAGDVTAVRIQSLQIGPLSAAVAFDRVIRSPLDRIAAPVEPVVVLVDALDEALTLSGETLVTLLESVLRDRPECLRFILTSRNEPRVLRRLGDATIDFERDAPPDVDDVGAYALRRLAGFSDEARATLSARVAEAGRGNFLYARYVVDGLLAAPPTGVDPVTVALPAGLEGHYREFLEREVAEADDSWRRLYRPLLGILAVARGDGVTRAQLAGAAGLRRSDADDALEALEQYLDASGPDGPFRFYHESFRDFLLAEETYRVYPDEAHAALGGFLAGEHADDWLRCRDAYALAHAPAHLTAAAGMAPDARTRNDLVRDVEALLVRLDFVAAKAFAEGTSSVEADLRTVEALDASDARLPQLRRVAAQCGSLLARCSSAEEAAATLASRVEHLDDLSKAASELRRMLGSPYVENWHMLPDLPHPSLLRSFPPDTFGLGDCDVSADCVVVAAAYDDCVRVWDANRGVEILTLEAPSSCCALSADGKRLAAGGEGGSVTVLSIDDNRECFTLDTSDDAIVRCALDGTGSTLVAASTGGVIVLDSSGNKRRLTTAGEPQDCAITGDGGVVAAALGEGGVKLWNTSTGEELPALPHEGEVACCALSADGALLVTGTEDGIVSIWDVSSQTLERRLEHGDEVGACAVSDDGELLVSVAPYGALQLWSRSSNEPMVLLEHHPTPSWRCAISGNGRLVASLGEKVRLWEPVEAANTSPPAGKTAWGCAIRRDGAVVATASYSDGLKLWDTATGAELSSVPALNEGAVVSCAIDDEGATLVSAQSFDWDEGGAAHVWDAATARRRATLPGSKSPVALTPDGRTIVAGTEHGLCLWDAETGETSARQLQDDPMEPMALTPDGSTLVAACRDGVGVWSMATSERHSVVELPGAVSSLAVTPDGATLAAIVDRSVVVVCPVGGSPSTLGHHSDTARACALSPDGSLLASGGDDRAVNVWRVASGELAARLQLDGQLFDCGWMPDGSHLVGVGTRGVYFLRFVDA